MKENNPSLEERIDFFEKVLNKFVEEQVMIEDAIKLMKKQIEAISTPELEEVHCKDAGGININEEI